MRRMQHLTVAASAAALAAVFAVSAIQPAAAQERKSIRWSTSNVDSYGYKVAASMTKILEEALGKDYTVTVLSLDHRRHESGDGWQWRDWLHGRRRHVRTLRWRRRLQGIHRRQRPARPHLVRLPDGILHGRPGCEGGRLQVLEGFQRQAGLLRRSSELAEIRSIYKASATLQHSTSIRRRRRGAATAQCRRRRYTAGRSSTRTGRDEIRKDVKISIRARRSRQAQAQGRVEEVTKNRSARTSACRRLRVPISSRKNSARHPRTSSTRCSEPSTNRRRSREPTPASRRWQRTSSACR